MIPQRILDCTTFLFTGCSSLYFAQYTLGFKIYDRDEKVDAATQEIWDKLAYEMEIATPVCFVKSEKAYALGCDKSWSHPVAGFEKDDRGTIAHELSHIKLNHNIPLALANIFFLNAVALTIIAPKQNFFRFLMPTLLLNSVIRVKCEREADLLSLKYLERNEVLERIEELQKQIDSNKMELQKGGFSDWLTYTKQGNIFIHFPILFPTHPAITERVKYFQKALDKL